MSSTRRWWSCGPSRSSIPLRSSLWLTPWPHPACEDAVQEALLEAALKWPAAGLPDNPRAWLITVAGRRLVDGWRSERVPGGGRKSLLPGVLRWPLLPRNRR
ncbi:sigma factor [Micrococcaceae bacterium Sec5.7]